MLKAKNDYILKTTSKLSDPKAVPKTYWSTLNRFLYNKKILSIPYLLIVHLFQTYAIDTLLVNSTFISDFRVKAHLFCDFFTSTCMPRGNGSTLPQFAYKTDVQINSFRVNQNYISLIIKTLDAKKAYGWNNTSIKIIQICCDPIALPLMLVFETALKEKKFPDICKKANVVPVHKKEGKNLLKNYCPNILVFERVIYNSLFNHFVSNKLITPSQSAFLPGGLRIAQPLAIIHEIKASFDSYSAVDVREFF